MASLSKIIDAHSHIITNLGSQAPTDKLPPWSIRVPGTEEKAQRM